MSGKKRGRPSDSRILNKTLMVRLSKQQYDRLQILADERNLSMSGMLRWLIDSYYKR